jgi:hypothetical protein
LTNEEQGVLTRLRGVQLEKVLVSLAIEQTLLSISKNVLDEVGSRLFDKYNCDFSECLAHPEYLEDILAILFGNSHRTLISSIYNNLQECKENLVISDFLVRINQYQK